MLAPEGRERTGGKQDISDGKYSLVKGGIQFMTETQT